MISVGSRDGRKRIGLGLEMEEAELEEGEAPSYREENDDSTIDPDVALSYLEEKVQNVLGHFQKDFEGVFSAENLGGKYGGYGSFLPTYQRSPSWSHSHTKSPAEVQNYDSPRKLHAEDQRQNFASSSASPSTRSRTTSAKAVVESSLKGYDYSQPKHAEKSHSKSGKSKKSLNDQRSLKVRIKVGSENLSTQKNAEIYSGLGLVVSPTSSLDDSPTTSEGQCVKHLDVPEESPSSILQIMTSYTGELLLSPLSDDLIHLPEKRKVRGKSETKPVDKTSKSSGTLVNGSLTNRSNQRVLEQKKLMASEKDDGFSIDLTYEKVNSNVDNNVSPLNKAKGTDIDMLGCDELVSNGLKLPLLSSSQHMVVDPTKDTSSATVALEDRVKGEAFSPFIEKGHLESESDQNIGRVEKFGGKLGSSGKGSESNQGNFVSNVAAFPPEDAPKAEKSHALDQSESNAFKGTKSLCASEPSDPSKELVVQKGGSISEEVLESALEKSSIGGKRKQKVSRSKGSEGAHMAKGELMVESSLTPKSGKNSHTNGFISKNDLLDLHKDHAKPGDRYKDFFGDVEFEDDDNESISGEMTSSGRLRNPQLDGKRSSSKDQNLSKEKHNSRNSEKSLPPGNYPRPASHLAPPLGNGQSSEAPAGVAPVVKEYWVECDKCKQWRLLPLGTNPKSLPDKWLCKMLNWLPGMNRCSIPEEMTTNALRSLYQPVAPAPAPASENLDARPYSSLATPVGVPSVDARRPAQEHHNAAVLTATSSGKKKHGSAMAANSADLDGSTHSSNSRRKSLGTSGINKLNSGNNSPYVDASGHQHMRQPNMSIEKSSDAKAEKISLVNSTDKGTNIKMKSKRESDMEGSRASKRMKSEELHFDDENWTSDNGGSSSKAGRRSSSLSNNTPGNDRYKFNNYKDLDVETKKNAELSMKVEMHVPTSGDDLRFSVKCDDEDSRKRKPKEHRGSRFHTGDIKEELSESEHRKEKKARLSKSGGKASSGSKTHVGTDRKSSSINEQHDDQYLDNTQATDYLKSDSVHPSVAANSSSSKVSDSHINKTNGQEVKGSPVESVSSSPLRFSNADKVTSTRKKLNGPDDVQDSGSLATVSPRRLSGGEDGGNDQTESAKKDAVSAVNNHVTDVYNDQLCQNNQYASNKHSSEHCKVEEKTINIESHNSGIHSKKSGKGLSSHFKDKSSASGSDPDKVNIKASDSRNGSMDHEHLQEEKSKSRRNKSDEKSGTPSKVEKFAIKNYSAGGTASEGIKGPSQKKCAHDGQDAIKGQDKKHKLQEEYGNDKLPKRSNQAEVHGNGKSHSLPPLARVQAETVGSAQPVSGSQKENNGKSSTVDAFDNGDAPKAHNQRKKSENSNGQPIRHPTPNSHKVRDVEAPSPLRRDSTSHGANNALKEAKDLKHMADRLKNSGSTESIGLYFQAALKFLHGASLLESGSSEATKHNDLMHSMHIYSSTAKLCEFCAHEYEKARDVAAAALAYKCVEVAYLRVVYSSHGSASRDRHEVQTALQIVPPGESPSSSASDVDNLNHPTAGDKAASAKVVGSPQVSGSHIITSRNRSGLLRVLNFAQDVNFAMEASRKSRMAFTAATSRLAETSHKESIHSLKKALDFNFQDVESLLRLVRIAMEAINR